MTPEPEDLEAGNARLSVQRAGGAAPVPEDTDFLRWARAALEHQDRCFEVLIRVVDEDESRRLNRDYRERDHATNVLSFPADLPEEIQLEMESGSGRRVLGDLVLCAPVIHREAAGQGKPPPNHWAHLVIHGILHLLGHSHDQEETAAAMELLEKEILDTLGIPDPY